MQSAAADPGGKQLLQNGADGFVMGSGVFRSLDKGFSRVPRQSFKLAPALAGGTHTPITIMACLLSLQYFLATPVASTGSPQECLQAANSWGCTASSSAFCDWNSGLCSRTLKLTRPTYGSITRPKLSHSDHGKGPRARAKTEVDLPKPEAVKREAIRSQLCWISEGSM